MLKFVSLALVGALLVAAPAQAMVNCEVRNWRGAWLVRGYWPTEARAREVFAIMLNDEWFYRVKCSPSDE